MSKVYYPNTEGVLKLMTLVFIIVFLFGSLIHVVKNDGFNIWMTFFKVSGVYVIACAVIYLTIKSQRIILDENKLVLKQLGITRHEIDLECIEEVRKGKLNGSPIMEIASSRCGFQQISPVPFLPFQRDWDEILQFIKTNCGDHVIGEMTLVRSKGELRTWME
jgi:hypothetical protein